MAQTCKYHKLEKRSSYVISRLSLLFLVFFLQYVVSFDYNLLLPFSFYYLCLQACLLCSIISFRAIQ
ncbi:hypothetical protein BDF20DRAFT_876902 [Mycotypha africana]|uniref:uncharacterized protein n=1 Tax=Mycotypha africana TaxID=64632 RepID=UPI0023005A04|nr:uncharacterized protein BDF20DRAFT_876902 [Mycotypha africana]KAI8975110.1 hypothetical protein BDF20DRAFT_876902 [Mycotypha africana]